MNLFEKMSHRPRVFERLTGLKLAEFKALVEKCRRRWHNLQNRKILAGRPHGIPLLENQILCLLLYYRTYTTQMFLGFWFGVDAATACRTIKRLEPILRKILALKKTRNIPQEELETLLVDATEQRIQRPSRNQRKYFSGKKKCHSLKTELVTNTDGRILRISRPVAGSIHDYKLHKNQVPLAQSSTIIADLGYCGLPDSHPKTVLPHKKIRNKKLSLQEKLFNKALSRVRVKIENKFRELKIFRILSDTYRNFRQAYYVKFAIIAGIVNLKMGF